MVNVFCIYSCALMAFLMAPQSSTSILIGDTFRMAALNRRVQSGSLLVTPVLGRC